MGKTLHSNTFPHSPEDDSQPAAGHAQDATAPADSQVRALVAIHLDGPGLEILTKTGKKIAALQASSNTPE